MPKSDTPPPPPAPAIPSIAEALANAARLLQNAEGETDRDLMGRTTEIADSWLGYASIRLQQEAMAGD